MRFTSATLRSEQGSTFAARDARWAVSGAVPTEEAIIAMATRVLRTAGCIIALLEVVGDQSSGTERASQGPACSARATHRTSRVKLDYKGRRTATRFCTYQAPRLPSRSR